MFEVTESKQNYLEIIYLLSKKGSVRAIDVVEMSGYSRPSVSNAVRALRNDGYITIDDTHQIRLTETGEEIAIAVYERHKCITEFFAKTLDIDEKTAEENACIIEHYITAEFYDAIKKYVENLK